MDRRERLNQIIRMLQESSRSSLDSKARFPRVSARTIERDIEQLALEGRIQPDSEARSRNPQWEAREAIPAIEVKWMSGRAAAAIKLMQGCVSTLLPETFIKDLQPLFLKADHALRQAHNREYADTLHGDAPVSGGSGQLPPEAIRYLVSLKQAIQQQQLVSLSFCCEHGSTETTLADAMPRALLMERGGISLLAGHHAHDEPLKINLNAIRRLELQGAAAPSVATPVPRQPV